MSLVRNFRRAQSSIFIRELNNLFLWGLVSGQKRGRAFARKNQRRGRSGAGNYESGKRRGRVLKLVFNTETRPPLSARPGQNHLRKKKKKKKKEKKKKKKKEKNKRAGHPGFRPRCPPRSPIIKSLANAYREQMCSRLRAYASRSSLPPSANWDADFPANLGNFSLRPKIQMFPAPSGEPGA